MIARVTAVLLTALALASLSQAQTRTPNGERIYAVLQQQGLLEDYLIEIASRVASDLVQASGRWQRFQINRSYDPSGVNIYLINSLRIPDGNPLAEEGVNLRRYNLQGNAMTIEKTKVMFIDTGLLKSLVAVAVLNDTRSMETWDAVATIRAYGLDAFTNLWEPAQNPQLTLHNPTAQWLIYYHGALAFLIGHELGHMALGPGTFPSKTLPGPLAGEDRKLYRACPALLDPAYRERQSYESAADDFAADLIGKVCGQLTSVQPRRFLYELGARWYFVVGMGQSLINALPMIENRVMQAYIKMDLGPQLYRDVLMATQAEDHGVGRGRIPEFFPYSHPPDHQRAAEALGRLTHSECSYFHGQPHPAPLLQQAMTEMLQQTCRDIASRYTRP